ncbi:MAG: CpaF/VirB11 family protein [Clostridiales Family XIII bacterium]|nr:CpaF/VirB11 family protein [Clostridiales Family XIII bacterium]
MNFSQLCDTISAKLLVEWGGQGGTAMGPVPGPIHAAGLGPEPARDMIEFQKRAIMGCEPEMGSMKMRIAQIIASDHLSAEIPGWYDSPESAVFHENWGLAGMAEWFGPDYADSGSAKIIGSRIYFLDRGCMKLMPQKISADRREQLVRALLLRTPEERLDKDRHEVYMSDGTRVTIFRGGLAKKGLDAIIFRRYIIPDLTFEGQADRNTIPPHAIPLFEYMVACGYNVVFCGSVRSAKTTFLSTWQRYEDPELEGVMVETDPEIPIHRLMPESPVIQLIADGERLAGISKSLMRSDADYFILAEARDGVALDTAVRLARKGTRRMKMTFHAREPRAFAYDAAVEIVRDMGGDIQETALRVAGSFDYVFHFSSMRKDKVKKLTAIYEMGLSEDGEGVLMHEICRYNRMSDHWKWTYHIGKDKRDIGQEEDADAFAAFEICLKGLHDRSRLS